MAAWARLCCVPRHRQSIKIVALRQSRRRAIALLKILSVGQNRGEVALPLLKIGTQRQSRRRARFLSIETGLYILSTSTALYYPRQRSPRILDYEPAALWGSLWKFEMYGRHLVYSHTQTRRNHTNNVLPFAEPAADNNNIIIERHHSTITTSRRKPDAVDGDTHAKFAEFTDARFLLLQ